MVYPTEESNTSLSEDVLLETGIRGGTHPVQTHALRSLVADFAISSYGDTEDTWEEFGSFEVRVLAPERTLLEKLALLHDASTRHELGQDTRLPQLGRHVYDVSRLLGSAEVRAALESLGPTGVGRLCADIDEHSASYSWSFTPRPSGGFGESQYLDTSRNCHKVLRAAYGSSNALIYGSVPTFDECLQVVRRWSGLI